MRKTKQISSGISNSGNHISMSKKNKNLFFALFVSLLLVAAIIIVVSGVNSRKYSGDNDIVKSTPPHSIIKTACSTTLYPELCFSAIASEPDLTQKVSTNNDVIVLSLNVTIRAVQHNYFTVKKMQSSKNLTKRGKTALHDCLETIDLSLDGLHRVVGELEEYPKNKSMSEYSDDLKTLLSATITYQETCLDGFSHGEEDRHVREGLRDGHVHVEHMSSNALAMVKNMTDTDIGNYEKKIGSSNRKMMEAQGGGIKWPKWMSAADRRLLQSTTVIPNVVVAADGTGNFRTVSAAVAAAPEQSSNRYIIKINAGTYSENVAVPKTKTNIMFVGDGASNTIITGSRNVADGSTTFDSATVAVVGERFLARGITFQNTAGPSKNQAVALRVGADLSAFYNCDILAYQDTLYVHSNRQFFVQCLIAGTVDFIFGNSAVVFQNCNIRPRRPNPGQENTITAQGRTDPNQNTGIVIQQCQIVANTDLAPVEASVHTYLGRPWKEYSRTVVMETYLGDLIDPAGWLMWSGNFALSTLYYGEYENTGPGADTSGRVNWQGFRVITSASEAQGFTPGSFIAGASWLGSTGFPYSLGL